MTAATTVCVWWDVDSITGSLTDLRDFLPHLHDGIRQRFDLGPQTRYRTTVFHAHTLHESPQRHRALPEDADVVDTGPQTVPQVLARKCQELREDYHPAEVLLWLVSTQPKAIELLRPLRQHGYPVFLVSAFDQLPKDTLTWHWLEIYSYYVIAHGDVRKLSGRPLPRSIQDRTLGFASPLVLEHLQLRCQRPAPTQPSVAFSRVIAPPLSPGSDDHKYHHHHHDDVDTAGSPMPGPEDPVWTDASRRDDPVLRPSV